MSKRTSILNRVQVPRKNTQPGNSTRESRNAIMIGGYVTQLGKLEGLKYSLDLADFLLRHQSKREAKQYGTEDSNGVLCSVQRWSNKCLGLLPTAVKKKKGGGVPSFAQSNVSHFHTLRSSELKLHFENPALRN